MGSRRAKIVIGLAAVVAAAVTATVPLAGADPDPSRTPTTATTSAPSPLAVAIVGDSLTAGAERGLHTAFGDTTLDVSAGVARGISTKARTDGFTGLTAIDDIRARRGEPERWVIALGTNDAVGLPPERYTAEITALVDHIGTGRSIVWVDIALPGQPEIASAWNGALTAVAAARPADLEVLAWSEQAADRPEWFAADQVHLTPDGYAARAAAIAAAVMPADPTSTSAPLPPTTAAAAPTTAAPPATTPPASTAAPTPTPSPSSNPTPTGPTAAVDPPVPLAAPAGLVPLPATRVLDTRAGGGRVQPGTARPVDLGAVLPDGATGVAATLTVTDPSGPGVLAAWPCDRPQPATVNLTFAAGAAASSLVLAGVDAEGRLCVATTASTDLVVDLSGAFMPDATLRLTTEAPRRLVDTRSHAAGPVTAAGMWFSIGAARAALLSVVTTGATAAGDVIVWPCNEARPDTSNGQIRPDRTDVHAAVVAADAEGRVCMAASAATQAVVTLVGAFADGDGLGFVPVDPTRIYDTAAAGPVAAGASATVATSNTVIVGSLTAASATPEASGWAALWSGAGASPAAATVSAPAGQAVTGFAAARAVDGAAAVTVTAGGTGDWSIAVDVTGLFT